MVGVPLNLTLGLTNIMNQDERRDQLAAERTHLANERTLLAYVRTSLALAASGAALLQFFPSYPSLFGLAWLLAAVGGTTMGIGTYRFFTVRSRLHGAHK